MVAPYIPSQSWTHHPVDGLLVSSSHQIWSLNEDTMWLGWSGSQCTDCFLWLVKLFTSIHKAYGIGGNTCMICSSSGHNLYHPEDSMMFHSSQRSRSAAWVLCCLDGQDLVYSLCHMLVIPFPCTHETCRNDGNTYKVSDNHMVIDTITYITLRVAWWFTVLSESSNTAMVPCGLDGQNTNVAY